MSYNRISLAWTHIKTSALREGRNISTQCRPQGNFLGFLWRVVKLKRENDTFTLKKLGHSMFNAVLSDMEYYPHPHLSNKHLHAAVEQCFKI